LQPGQRDFEAFKTGWALKIPEGKGEAVSLLE
jgi:hypothetical protein